MPTEPRTASRTFRYPQAIPATPIPGDAYVTGANTVKLWNGSGWLDWDPQIDPPIKAPTGPLAGGITTPDLVADPALAEASGLNPFAQGPAMLRANERQANLAEAQTTGMGAPPIAPERSPIPPPVNPMPSAADIAIRTGLRVGGDLGGRFLGGLAGGALAVPEAATGAGIAAIPATVYAGYKAGGAIGSGLGEYLAEKHEEAAGDRPSVNPWQVAGQTALGAVDLPGWKALDKLPGMKQALAKGGAYATQAVGLGVPAAAASQLTDDLYYDYGTPEERKARMWEAAGAAIGPAAAIGAVAGSVSALPKIHKASQVASVRKAFEGATGFAKDPDTGQVLIVRQVASGGSKPALVPTPVSAAQLPLLRQAFPDLAEVSLPEAPKAVTASKPAPAPQADLLPVKPDLPAEFAPVEPIPAPVVPPPSGVPGAPRPNLSDPTGAILPEFAGGLGGAAVGAVGTQFAPIDEDNPLGRPGQTLANTLLGGLVGAGGTRALARRGGQFLPPNSYKGTWAQQANDLTPLRADANRTRYSKPLGEPFYKTIGRLPKTAWEGLNYAIDRDYDLTTKPAFFAPQRTLFSNFRSMVGSIPHRTLRTVVSLAKPRGVPAAEGMTKGTDYFAYSEMRKQAGLVFDYERQAARNTLRIQQGEAPAPFKLEGLPALSDAEWAALPPAQKAAHATSAKSLYDQAHLFAETAWNDAPAHVKSYHQRVVAHFDRLGGERVAMGAMSQETLDTLRNDPRPWLRYWPSYVLDEDDAIKGYYYGGAHPARPESMGRDVFREGHTSKVLDDPIEVIYRYTAAHEADKLHKAFWDRTVAQYDPRQHNPNIKINDPSTWPQGPNDTYVRVKRPVGGAGSEQVDPLTAITKPSRHEEALLPVEISRNLNRTHASLNPVWAQNQHALHKWNRLHRSAILNPLSVGLVYDITNLVGDGIAALMGTPITRWPALGVGVAQAGVGRFVDPTIQAKFDQYSDLLGLGGAGAELTETTMRHPLVAGSRPPDVQRLGESALSALNRKFARAWEVALVPPAHAVNELRRYRESVIRMGSMFERMDAGLPPEQAAAVTRHMLVDYDSLTPEESRYLKGILFPFWTYAARTFQRLTPGLNRDPLTGSKVDGAFSALGAHSKGAAAHLALMSFNEAFFPEAEANTEWWMKEMPHLQVPIGVFEDGRVELATILFGGKEVVEKGLLNRAGDMLGGGPAFRFMNWVAKQADALEKADYDPAKGAVFWTMGFPSPRNIAGNLVGLGGTEQKAFDYAVKREDRPFPLPEEMAKAAYDTWSGLLSSVVTIPALFGAPVIGLSSTDIRGRRTKVGEGLPFLGPDSINPFAEGTNLGEKLQAAARQTPGVSLWNRAVRASDDDSGDWADYAMRATLGSLVRVNRGTPAQAQKQLRLMAEAAQESRSATDARTRQLTQVQTVAGFISTEDGLRAVTGPAFYKGEEGPPMLASVWRSTFDEASFPNQQTGDSIRALLTKIAKAKANSNDQPNAWRALYTDLALFQGMKHLSKDAKARFAAKTGRDDAISALPFFDRFMTERPVVETPTDQVNQLNEQLGSANMEEFTKKLKALMGQEQGPPAPIVGPSR